MIPRSTGSRMQRESARGKVEGRTQEIQRLIGRSLRAVIDLSALGERQIIVDCDVIRADGGTRTASITGGFVALYLACKKLHTNKIIKSFPITNMVSAISCGLVTGSPLLDLEYIEDSNADVDANFIFTDNHKMIEIQMTAEKGAFSEDEFNQLMLLAKKGTKELFKLQKQALGI
jgi:ribonuclease PH